MKNKFTAMYQAAKSTKKQRGYTIVELSVAVAIAGVLLVGSISLVQTVLNTSRANDTITGLSRTLTQITKIWSSANNYDGLTTATAIAAGAFVGLTTTSTTVTSKFNRPVTVTVEANIGAGGSVGTGAKMGYDIVYTGIPTSVCADIVTAAGSSGVRGILIAPETTPGTNPLTLGTLTIAAGALTAPSGSTVVLDGSLMSLKLTSTAAADGLTGTNGCGTDKGTVSLIFVNWK